MAKNPLANMMAQAVQPGAVQAPPGIGPLPPQGAIQSPKGKTIKPPAPPPPPIKGKLPGKGPPKGFPPKQGG